MINRSRIMACVAKFYVYLESSPFKKCLKIEQFSRIFYFIFLNKIKFLCVLFLKPKKTFCITSSFSLHAILVAFHEKKNPLKYS